MGNFVCCDDPTFHDDDVIDFKIIKASDKPKLMLFFVRHGERIDQVDELTHSEEV